MYIHFDTDGNFLGAMCDVTSTISGTVYKGEILDFDPYTNVYTYVDGKVVVREKTSEELAAEAAAGAEIITISKMIELREERNKLLAESDWTQVVDSPLDDTTKAEWQTYRQALRDITETYSSLDDIVWPTKPEV